MQGGPGEVAEPRRKTPAKEESMRAATVTWSLFFAAMATLALATAAQAGKLYSGSLVLHAFANDTTSGSQPPYATYTFQALPLGAYCNPGNGGASCDTATLHNGAPLTGSGSALTMTTGMGTALSHFTLAASDLRRTTFGSLPPYPRASYTLTTASLRNATGHFAAGAGPGSFSFFPKPANGGTRVRVTAGPKQFGGVMRLIGRFGTRNAGSTPAGAWYGIFPDWGLNVVGESYASMGTVQGTLFFESPTSTFTSSAVITGFPWTTGRASVSAAEAYRFPTRLVRSGYDNRTPAGAGTIQMVSPRLTRWAAGSHWGDIAVLRLKFAPEPGSWLLLAAGAAALGLLRRAHRQL
jgi:hypothetical protein